MKKNRTMRVAALLLALTLITSCFVGGTFAKYISDATVEDTAIVAKWSFKVGEDDIAGTTTKTLKVNLFDTVADDATPNGADDANVENGENPIIAPGTGGKFAFTLTNESQVAAKYAVDYTVDEAGVPLQFSTDGSTWTADLADIAASDETTLGVDAEAATVTVYWKWAFEGDNIETSQTDITDTTLGVAASATPKITVKITATQVD